MNLEEGFVGFNKEKEVLHLESHYKGNCGEHVVAYMKTFLEKETRQIY